MFSNEQKPCYLLGDYNIDLFKYQQHFHTNNYLDTMFWHCFLALINRPTRITSHSASLIDNIFTNNLSHNLRSGILFTDISDHLPIFTLLSLQDSNKNIQTLNFIEDLLIQITKKNSRKNWKKDWKNVYETEHPDEAYKNFVKSYNKIVSNCFPYKAISRNRAKLYTKP